MADDHNVLSRGRGIMRHFKRGIQAQRSSELKTDNHSVDSQNLYDTGLKIYEK
ncbi:TPA: hypothetical protein JAJ74_002314 [Legionella pneumophila]|nr:hypothetical protein [Legionella pneumophila]HAT6338451.1 hypothetical protein [Legionella pneumophila]HAT6373586.1 hypothetical protein [Legionella pneumophila]HAT6376668.1 hypothetical protein [Legionella pneumophila]HAT6395040.1 hypothetical protein [Legionella pneumophila]